MNATRIKAHPARISAWPNWACYHRLPRPLLLLSTRVFPGSRLTYNSGMAGISIFSQELGESICSQIEAGKSLRAICESPDSPISAPAVCKWVRRDDLAPGFGEQYARARTTAAELMADTIVELADTANAVNYNAVRLQVETRKWILSKVLPKVYGDAQLLKHADADGNVLRVELTRVNSKPRVIDVTPTPVAQLPEASSNEGSD